MKVILLFCFKSLIMCRYQLSEDGEWLVNKLNVEVERAEDDSISLQDLRKISKLAAQRSADYCVTQAVLC